MSISINHIARITERLVTQFKESTTLIEYIKALLGEANTLEDVFQSLLTERWIDTAVGRQLDILGIIVGQPRDLLDASLILYFGFQGHAAAQSFGTLSNPSIGGRFRSYLEPISGSRRLTDDEYRIFIRAKIMRNQIYPNINEMISFFQFLMEVEKVIITEGAMSYSVDFGRILDPNEIYFIQNTELVPKVAGVSVEYFMHDPSNTVTSIPLSSF